MKIVTAVLAAALALPAAPSLAVSGLPRLETMAPAGDAVVERTAARGRSHRYHPRYRGSVGQHGGYRVNRYGFGNYVGGPRGGFAGYPAGSAGARIYRQKQEWKCQAVPETC